MFTGGEDVHPSLYGGRDVGLSSHNLQRDNFEIEVFNFCLKNNVKVTGICRGFQFINVMAGGRMYQHIEMHPYMHTARFGYIDELMEVNSTHHQLVDLPSGSIPLVWAEPKLVKNGYNYLAENKIPPIEVEGAIFPNINGFGVQFHPEILDQTMPAVIEYRKLLLDFINTDLDMFIQRHSTEVCNAGI